MEGKSGGITVLTALAMVFVVLKLVGVIGWSWWWVLSPVWIEILISVALLAFVVWLAK